MKGIGVDIVDSKKLDLQVAEKILSEKELSEFNDYLKTNKTRARDFLGGRLAAKEAYLKAINVGIYQGVNLSDIQVYKDENGVPKFKNIQNAFLTLSHESGLAVAVVVIL